MTSPTPPNDDIAHRMAAIVDELFGVPAEALADDVELQDGLQLDSLSVIELQMALEDAFDIRFDRSSTEGVTTYGRLVAVVREAVLRKVRSA